jgi:hypothetical protein
MYYTQNSQLSSPGGSLYNYLRPEELSLTSKFALASLGSQGTMGGLLLAGNIYTFNTTDKYYQKYISYDTSFQKHKIEFCFRILSKITLSLGAACEIQTLVYTSNPKKVGQV